MTRANFDAQAAGLTPDLRIMDFMDAQPEFTRSFWEYLDTLVSDARIENGRKILAQYRATFDAVEKERRPAFLEGYFRNRANFVFQCRVADAPKIAERL